MALPSKVGTYLRVHLDGYHFIFDGDTYSGGAWHATSPYIQLDGDSKILGEWDEELLEDEFYIENSCLPSNCRLTSTEISTGVISTEKQTALRSLILGLLESEVLILGSGLITPVGYDTEAVGQTCHGYLAPHLPDVENHATYITFGARVISNVDLHSGGGE